MGYINYLGRDNDSKDQAHQNHRLVKSNCSKATRITLRGTNLPATTRPPWNSGTLPSATSTKASAVGRTARTLPKKLPIRGKLPTQEEFSSHQNNKHAPALKATLPDPSPTIEPRKSNITLEAESDFTWGYDLENTFLEQAGGTISAAKYVGSNQIRRNSDTSGGKASGAGNTRELRQACDLAQKFADGVEEDSFLNSALMTSPRLKLPLSSSTLIAAQSSPSKAKYPSITSIPIVNQKISCEDLLTRERRRVIELSVHPRDKSQKGSLIPTQGQQRSPVQLDDKLYNNIPPTFEAKPHSKPAVEKTQCPIPAQWFVRIDPDASDDEHTLPQVAVSPVAKLMNKPWLRARSRPDSLFGVLDQFAGNGYLYGLKTDNHENICPIPINRNDLQYEEKVAAADRSAGEMEFDSLCHADGESTGEDDKSKSRSNINGNLRLRQPRSRKFVKSIKWDPAIISYGPEKNEIKIGKFQVFKRPKRFGTLNPSYPIVPRRFNEHYAEPS
jgi:hypothetical protein